MKKKNKMYKTTYKSPVGVLTLVSDGYNLIGLFIEEQKYFMNGFYNVEDNCHIEVFYKTKELLDRYFNGEVIDNKDIPIKFIGTKFRSIVFNVIRDIPYGRVVTYKEVGDKIKDITGKNVSYQAIGSAIGHNPISIIVPCHRVVGSNGRLGGYAGGVHIKKKLLEMEGVNYEF